MALPRRRGGADPARADDERAQRRLPRRQLGRLPGVHDRPGRRAELLRGAADGRRGLPSPEGVAARPGHGRGRRRRGRLRAQPGVQRGGARRAHEGHRGGGLHARRGPRDRARPGHQRDLRRGPLQARARGPRAVLRRDGGLLGRRLLALSDPLARGRHGRGGLGRLEGPHAARRRPRPARRRRPLRDQHRAPGARDRARRRQLDPDQGQPDRDAVGDARGDRDGARGRLHRGHVAPLRRDRGHDDRRPRRRDRLRADQDRRPVALGPRGEVQPAAAHRGGARGRRGVLRPGGLRCNVAEGGSIESALRPASPCSTCRRSRLAWQAKPLSRALDCTRGRRQTVEPTPDGDRAHPHPLGPPRPVGAAVRRRAAALPLHRSRRGRGSRPGARRGQKREEVATLRAENERLQARRDDLRRASALEREARRLGMVKAGERAYIIEGLPEPLR